MQQSDGRAYLAPFIILSSDGFLIPTDELRQKYTNSESRFIKINGIDVHYRDEGRGPVILCIHGIVSSLHTWDGWVDELKSTYRIIRLDVPGYGLTGPANFAYNRDNYMRFFKNFVDALGLKEFHLAGNSLGGYMAWNFTARYPELVKKLILLDPAGYPQKVPGPVTLFTQPVIGNLGQLFTPKFIFTHYIKEVYSDKKKITRSLIDRYYELMMRKGNRKACREIFKELRIQARLEPIGVNTIKTPTLLMWGRNDAWIPVQLLDRYKKDIPHARSIIYDGVGHVPMEEIPHESAADAKKFLRGR